MFDLHAGAYMRARRALRLVFIRSGLQAGAHARAWAGSNVPYRPQFDLHGCARLRALGFIDDRSCGFDLQVCVRVRALLRLDRDTSWQPSMVRGVCQS